MRLFLTAFLVLAAGLCMATEYASGEVLYDFAANIGKARQQTGSVILVTEVSSGGAARRAIFQPPDAESPSSLSYDVALPRLSTDNHLYVMTYIGLRDGSIKSPTSGRFDGTGFHLRVNDNTRLMFAHKVCKWVPIAFCLDQQAGTTVTIGLMTDCIKHVENDAPAWGNPMIVLTKPAAAETSGPQRQHVHFPSQGAGQLARRQGRGFYLFKCAVDPSTPGLSLVDTSQTEADVDKSEDVFHIFASYDDYDPGRSRSWIVPSSWAGAAKLRAIVDLKP